MLRISVIVSPENVCTITRLCTYQYCQQVINTLAEYGFGESATCLTVTVDVITSGWRRYDRSPLYYLPNIILI